MTIMEKNNKFLKVLSLLAVLTPLALTGCKSQTEKFEEYCDDVLVAYLGGDQLAINLFFKDAAAYGFDHYDADWYTYEKTQPGEMEGIINENKRLLKELDKFKYDELTELQQVTYNQMKSMFEGNIKQYSIPDFEYMNLYYIDQFGGYVANVASYMETYNLRNEQDVKDLIHCVKSTEEAFKSYLEFAQDKVDHGYPYNDFTLESMSTYLEDLLKEGDDYYLYEYLQNKFDACEFLDDAKKASYKQEVVDALKNDFFVGVDELNKGLDQFKNKADYNQERYWAGYGEVGKQLYEIEIKNVLGMPDLNFDEYIKTLESEIDRTTKASTAAFNVLARKHNIKTDTVLDSYIKYNPIYGGTPDEKMVYLKEFAKSIVPDLKSEPSITIKEMDASAAKVSNAVAYYTKSAVDEFDHEYITLNNLKLGNDNDVLGTLAHEGYPGHLYEYVHAKELGLHEFSIISGNLAHAEGWATYVEYALYDYAIKNAKGETNNDVTKAKDVIKYLKLNHESGFLLECRLDIGIHYQGWSVKQVGQYLGSLGYNEGAAQEIHDLLIEMPATYQAYGYGKYFFVKLHNEAKAAVSNYNEVEFNEKLLSHGWVGLGDLQQLTNEYIASKQG